MYGGRRVAGYLTQIFSIRNINSAKERDIKSLAMMRAFFNGISIFKNIRYWYNSNIDLNLLASKAAITLNMFVRSYYIFKDTKIYKNATKIALSNKIRNDKNLRNKKIGQYAWVTLNYFFAPFMKFLKGHESDECYYAYSLVICSELYRQNLMYKMLENKQKIT